MEGFYAAREKVLDDARHRLARVRAKVPAPTVLDLPAERLRTAAERFFEDREDELDVAARELAASRARVPVPDDRHCDAAGARGRPAASARPRLPEGVHPAARAGRQDLLAAPARAQPARARNPRQARWTREREHVAEQIGLREPIDFQSELRPPREP